MYQVLHRDGRAKSAKFDTPHGTVMTPVFMNVGTAGAMKGALTTGDLNAIGTQVVLCNTYHLLVRPGNAVVKSQGGIRRFMAWDGPVLTDSGGFQVFSLSRLRKISEEGVTFHSHIDGKKIFMGPEQSIGIQSDLGSTIAMALDECPPYPATRTYMQNSVDRTTRWLLRCRDEMARLNTLDGTLNRKQMLFGINQGGTFEDIRKDHAKQIAELDLDGYALGGLAVGESAEQMYDIIEKTVPYLPQDKPTYLMGVGTPENILEAVERGVDFFDCVYPARNGRHGHAYTGHGKLNLYNAKYETDDRPLDETCACPVCQTYSRAYIRHLLKAKETLGLRLMVTHNLYFYNTLMKEIRKAIQTQTFLRYKKEKLSLLALRGQE